MIVFFYSTNHKGGELVMKIGNILSPACVLGGCLFGADLLIDQMSKENARIGDFHERAEAIIAKYDSDKSGQLDLYEAINYVAREVDVNQDKVLSEQEVSDCIEFWSLPKWSSGTELPTRGSVEKAIHLMKLEQTLRQWSGSKDSSIAAVLNKHLEEQQEQELKQRQQYTLPGFLPNKH